MHFWIDKRSSQLHQYGGAGRRPGGAGGFYSQNFGTHRNSHHPPPPSLCHHHPHRVRTRTAATNPSATSASSSSNSAANNNNNAHMLSIVPNNNNVIPSSTPGMVALNGNSTTPATTIALQYPHQQPHQVQGQHSLIGTPSYANPSAYNVLTGSAGMRVGRHASDAGRNNAASAFYGQTLQQPPIVGGGILAISGSSSNAINAAAALNPPVAIVSNEDGDAGPGTTVLTFPSGATSVAVNPSNSINVQLISCVNINPDNRGGGIDLSWRNPYHVAGSSVSRCRAYSRDAVPSTAGTSSVSSSRGTRGRRTSSSSSSGLGRSSIGTIHGNGVPSLSNHSHNAPNEGNDGIADRSTRSERTSFDRDTITTQRSLSLTSPDAVEQSSSADSTGRRASMENDANWACTKRVGLTLCFLAFILLGTVGAKFMIQGPGVIDTSRTGKAEAAAYFLFTELIFIAFAMALFFTGVACLRKRTNDYLLRQFNQYIMHSSSTNNVTGNGANVPPGQENYDFEYYEGRDHHPSGGNRNESPSTTHHLLHHSIHHYRHHLSDASLMEEGDFGSGDISHGFHGAGPIHFPAHYGSGNSSRHGRSKNPPPYHIALYLPLPEGMGGGSTTIDESLNTEQGKSNKSFGATDGIIDSSSNKDAQTTANNSNATENLNNESRDANPEEEGFNHNRSETPPPPYEQI